MVGREAEKETQKWNPDQLCSQSIFAWIKARQKKGPDWPLEKLDIVFKREIFSAKLAGKFRQKGNSSGGEPGAWAKLSFSSKKIRDSA